MAKSITEDLKITKSQTIINLASQEYSKAAQLKKIDAKIVSPSFKDEKNGKFKIISFYAKRARGLMANFIITNKIESENDIKEFSMDGYSYSSKDSSANEPVFLRSEKARIAA